MKQPCMMSKHPRFPDLGLICLLFLSLLLKRGTSQGFTAAQGAEAVVPWQELSPLYTRASFSLPLAQALWNQAQEILHPEEWTNAESEYQLAERVLRTTLNWTVYPSEKAEVQIALGNLAEDRDDFTGARWYYEQAVLLSERQEEPRLRSRAYFRLGIILFLQEDWNQGEALCRRALQSIQQVKVDSVEKAYTLGCLGLILGQELALEESQTYLEYAQDILETRAPKSYLLGGTYLQLGVTARMQAEHDRAEYWLQRALRNFQAGNARPVLLAETFRQLGKLDEWRRRPVSASSHYTTALRILQQHHPESHRTAELLMRSARICLLTNTIEEGIRLATASLALSRRSEGTTESPRIANTLVLLARLHQAQGNLEMARALILQAREIRLQESRNSYWTAETENQLAKILWESGELTEARKASDRGIEIVQELASETLWLAEFQRDRGLLEANGGNPTASLRWLQDAVNTLEHQISHLAQSRVDYRSWHHDYYQHLVLALIRGGQPTKAFETLERSRAQGFRIMRAEHEASKELMDVPATVQHLKLKLEEQLNSLRFELLVGRTQNQGQQEQSLRDELFQAKLDYEKLLRQFTVRPLQLSPRSSAQDQGKQVSDMQSSLDQETLLVSFFVAEQESFVFTLGNRQELATYSLPINQGEVQRKVQQIRSLILSAHPQHPQWQQKLDRLRVVGRDLFIALFPPALRHSLSDFERLLILPDGALHSLPWSTLRTDDHYLIEKVALFFGLSGSSYSELRSRSSSELPPVEFTAFGNPSFPIHLESADGQLMDNGQVFAALNRGFKLRQLPFSQAEVEQVGALFGSRSRIFFGPDAIEERAKGTLRTRYLHFATHTLSDSQWPLHPALLLSLPEQVEVGKDNGILEMREILSETRLQGTDLVVLSSCESALGREMRGDGPLSLALAFQVVGARAVIGSLWPIADRSTAVIMTRFYKKLASGTPPILALQQVQIEMIGSGDPELSAPYAWGAFLFYGNYA